MNMKKFLLPILICAGLFTMSCSQDLLEIPQKGVNSIDSFYKTEADAESALVNVYARFTENVCGCDGIYNPQQILFNYSGDDVYAAGGNPEDHAPFRYFNEFRYDASNSALQQAYQRYYFSIYACNLLIDNFTKEGSIDTPVVRRCIAEARVIRAYCHMMLAIGWQRPPLVDHVLAADAKPENVESQKFLLDWCATECEAAANDLDERQSPTDKDGAVKVTKGFAWFVAGKSAVFANDMSRARTDLSKIIESKKYELVPGDRYAELFHLAGDGDEEKIFEANFVYNSAITGFGPVLRSRWMVANTLNWRTAVLAAQPPFMSTAGWGGGAINEKFADKFYKHDGDSPRRKATFLTADEFLYTMQWPDDLTSTLTLEQKKSDPGRGIKLTEGMFGRATYFEIKNITTKEDGVSQIMGGSSNQSNYRIARYAEALLLYAEACIGSSDADKGAAALHAIQDRAGVPETPLTLANVQEEKSYELWFEGCRFPDVVRWGIADEVFKGQADNYPTAHDEFFEPTMPGYGKEHKIYATYSQPYANIAHGFIKGQNEYFPFPESVVSINPNLKQLNGWASVTTK